jgi:hypothetical protein
MVPCTTLVPLSYNQYVQENENVPLKNNSALLITFREMQKKLKQNQKKISPHFAKIFSPLSPHKNRRMKFLGWWCGGWQRIA